MGTPTLTEAIKKTRAVIISCKTKEQLVLAERYLNLFYEIFVYPFSIGSMHVTQRLMENLVSKKREELDDL